MAGNGAIQEQLRRLGAHGSARSPRSCRSCARRGEMPGAAELAEEAKDLARRLESGRLDRQLVERQERLFRRMLDAGRTLQGRRRTSGRSGRAPPQPTTACTSLRPSGHDCWATTIACECRRGKSCSSSPPRSAGSWWTTSGVFRRRDDDSRAARACWLSPCWPFRWPLRAGRPSPAPSSWSARGKYGAAAEAYRAVLAASRPIRPRCSVSSACWCPSTGPARFCRKSGRHWRQASSGSVYGVALRAWAAADEPDSMRAVAMRWTEVAPATRRRIGSGERRRWTCAIVGPHWRRTAADGTGFNDPTPWPRSWPSWRS